jgi:hypothetical protein
MLLLPLYHELFPFLSRLSSAPVRRAQLLDH